MPSATNLLLLSLLALTTLAHPGEEHEDLSPSEHTALHKRLSQAKSCEPVLKRHQETRRALRGLSDRKRAVNERASSCVLTPELVEGPYYINDELVRNNLREDMAGLNITLDIQVIDSTTCEPMSDVFVEFWHANYLGNYAGYTGATGTALTEDASWLRGGNVVDSNGNITIDSFYPGHYSGRTAHIHLMVHSNYTINENGTLASHAGAVQHVGQLFFEQDLNDEVFATSPYTNVTDTATTNDEDSILAVLVAADYPPYVQTDYIGDDLASGLYVYTSLVIDTAASYSINNQNFAPSFTWTGSNDIETSAAASATASTAASASSSESTTAASLEGNLASTSSASSSSGTASSGISSASAAATSSSGAIPKVQFARWVRRIFA